MEAAGSYETVGQFARPACALSPDTKLGMAATLLRSAPYRVLPLVEDDVFLGWVTETQIARAFLGAPHPAERNRLRHTPLREWMETPPVTLLPETPASEALRLLQEHHVEALPVLRPSGHYLGLVSAADFVQELSRPFTPPMVGGMATPLGVYLTSGSASGGVGHVALVLTGLFLFTVQASVLFLLLAVGNGLERYAPDTVAWVHRLPGSIGQVMGMLLLSLTHAALLMTVIRLSPLAGYHAAEHQVVHALERSEPLLVDAVRTMPRVHPRCGTNLVAFLFLLSLGEALRPWVGWFGYLASVFLALLCGRSLGAFLQQHLTTRPATPAEIESGIQAAERLLACHHHPTRSPSSLLRLWHTGLLQMLLGFCIGAGVLYGLAQFFPGVDALLRPLFSDL
jgi:CBS domain-containing protein